jgi:hypothetical protein
MSDVAESGTDDEAFRKSLGARNAMLMGISNSETIVLTLRLGTAIVDPD